MMDHSGLPLAGSKASWEFPLIIMFITTGSLCTAQAQQLYLNDQSPFSFIPVGERSRSI